MRSKTILALVAFVLFDQCLQGAEPATQSVQLRFVSLNQPIQGAGIADAEGKATPLVIPSSSLGRPIPHASRRVRLVSTSPDAPGQQKPSVTTGADSPPAPPRGFRRSKEDEAPRKVKAGNRELGTIDLPSGDHQRFIIIVHPGKGNGLTAIPDRIGFFPPGSDRYVNLTAATVIIDVPSGRLTLPPNGSIVLRPGVTNLRQYHLKLMTKSGGEEEPFFAAFTAQDDERRNLRILIPENADGTGIVMKTISDGLAAKDNYR